MFESKQFQRERAYAERQQQPDKDRHSATICRWFMELPQYQRAKTVMWYVDCRSEVRTRAALKRALHSDKRCVIPYCTEDTSGQHKLGLWHVQDLNELVPGRWNIPEPPRQRWFESGKQVKASELDLIMVPGVAFDRGGGRLGNGAGYYDRLLSEVRPDAFLAGVCFDVQIVAEVVCEAHDVAMDCVLSEGGIYPGRGRQ